MKKQTNRHDNMEKKLQNLRKRIKGFLIGSVCVFCLLIPIQSLAESGTITSESVNIRANANTASTVIGSALKGNTVDIIGKVTAADGFVWYQVYVDATTKGFIRSDMVSTTDTIPNITITTAETTQIATITGNGVWVRSEPSTKTGTTLVSLEKGMNVNLLKSEGDWSHVNFVKDGTLVEGYIWADYVTLGDLDLSEPEIEEVVTPEEPNTTDTLEDDFETTDQNAYVERGAVVQKNGVRVRSDASTSASMVGSVDQNDAVTVIGEKIDSTGALWYNIRFVFLEEETTGYVRGDFLVVEEVIVEEPVVEEPVVEEPVVEEPVVEETTDPVLQPDGSLVLNEPEEKKSNKALIWVIQILILLVIAGTFVYLKLTDYVDHKADKKPIRKKVYEKPKKSFVKQVAVEETKIQESQKMQEKVHTGQIPVVDPYEQMEQKTVSIADIEEEDDMELLFLNSDSME